MNVTIFAYGQTGSGKTHTMLGHRGEKGVIHMALAELFRSASDSTKVTVSFVELYNEEIRDLLIDGPDNRQAGDHGGQGGLDLREDPIRGPMIAGVTEVPANDVDRVMGLLKQGNDRRTQDRPRGVSFFVDVRPKVSSRDGSWSHPPRPAAARKKVKRIV